MEELLCFIYHRSNTNLSDGVRITLDKNNVFNLCLEGILATGKLTSVCIQPRNDWEKKYIERKSDQNVKIQVSPPITESASSEIASRAGR